MAFTFRVTLIPSRLDKEQNTSRNRLTGSTLASTKPLAIGVL